MTLFFTKPVYTEGLAITKLMLATLAKFKISPDESGAHFRSAVGKTLVNFYDLVFNQTIGTELLNCFDLAVAAGATLDTMDGVRIAMLDEAPLYLLGKSLVNASVIFTLSEQTKLITPMEFKSRTQVTEMIDRMMPVFEEVRVGLAESFTVNDYRNFVALSASLIQHLSETERQLPRIVNFHWHVVYPSLTMSQRIYGVGDRSEELIAENRTVHPAFMQRDVIALSE